MPLLRFDYCNSFAFSSSVCHWAIANPKHIRKSFCQRPQIEHALEREDSLRNQSSGLSLGKNEWEGGPVIDTHNNFYFVLHGKLHFVPDHTTFIAMGFVWGDLKEHNINADLYELGTPLNSTRTSAYEDPSIAALDHSALDQSALYQSAYNQSALSQSALDQSPLNRSTIDQSAHYKISPGIFGLPKFEILRKFFYDTLPLYLENDLFFLYLVFLAGYMLGRYYRDPKPVSGLDYFVYSLCYPAV